MAFYNIQHEYMQIPPVTRTYTTACVLTTLVVILNTGFPLYHKRGGYESLIKICENIFNFKQADGCRSKEKSQGYNGVMYCIVQLDIVSPFQLYFNPDLIIKHYQAWRLVTTFLFFGSLGFNFLFNMIFTYRYCRMLEEGSFRGRTADFLFMFLFGGTVLIIIALFVNLLFLGQAFTIMLVYIWSRRNPYIRMNFFGLINFQAPFLPWVLLGFSVLLGNSVMVDVMGIAVGHLYYFLEDIFPNQTGGFQILKTPYFIKYLFDIAPDDPNYHPLLEDQPGGFDLGAGDVPPQ